jgi:hypothetical protein
LFFQNISIPYWKVFCHLRDVFARVWLKVDHCFFFNYVFWYLMYYILYLTFRLSFCRTSIIHRSKSFAPKIISIMYWVQDYHFAFCARRVWRYHWGNQNPFIEEQTIQWPKEKVQKDKQRSTKHTYKTKDRVTRTPLKTGVLLHAFCEGRHCANMWKHIIASFH